MARKALNFCGYILAVTISSAFQFKGLMEISIGYFGNKNVR